MYEIDAVAAKIPVLLNSFFRHQHGRGRMKVFLCGRKPSDRRFDLRTQVKRLLEGQMGCEASLGEDIEELSVPPRPDQNHLTIEVKEAARSDLIFMFLGSPGTIAEVTAFAMDERVNSKLVVFNQAKYKDQRSFINLGPLRLIPSSRIVYYDGASDSPTVQLVSQLDQIVAQKWFHKSELGTRFSPALPFEAFVCLAILLSAFPVRYKELVELFPLDERTLKRALGELFKAHLISEDEKKYLPQVAVGDLPIDGESVADIARTRAALLSRRMKDPDAVTDYRLIL